MSDKARTIFLGTGGFAVPVVAALAQHPDVDLLAVVTAARREGKTADPPVATWASNHERIATFRPARLRAESAVEHIRDHAPDLLLLADYGQIVPASLLELPRYGALNLHPSLLPRHRGATPIPAAIMAGDAETGVSLMLMDAGLDTGPIVAQTRRPLTGTETAPRLEEELADQAARLLTATLAHWLNGEITPDPQLEADATLTRPLRRSNGLLDPAQGADQLERQVRAYQPWPGTYFEIESDRLVVWRAHPIDGAPPDLEVGDLWRPAEGGLALRVADRALQLDEVQPAGGRRMTGAELVRGRPGLIGERIR